MQTKKKKQILIIKHGALGDIIQSVGILMDIRCHYPDCKLTLLTEPTYLQLMKRCPYIDHIIVDNRAPIWRVDQQFKLQKNLQRQSFDLVIDLQNSDRSRIYRQFWFSKLEWIGRNSEAEETSSGLSGLITLLNEAGIVIKSAHHPDMSWMVEDVGALLKKHNIGEDYIVLIPGSSSQHLDKRWPYYPGLAKALIETGHQVIVILGPAEVEIGKQMLGNILSGLNWFELAGVLNGAKFIVGNDTGPSHIASYLNKAGVALFGHSTSAARSEIGHRNFKTIEVDSLVALKVEYVLEHIMQNL